MKTITDTFWEHTQHDTYRSDCSTCFSERVVPKKSIRNQDEELGFDNSRALGRCEDSFIRNTNPFRD